MKLSVAVITYNQQDTIAQTLDSILMQKGDFDIELVIGEDCSSDNTWNICHEYAERYPEIVRLLPNTQNLGIMRNFARVMQYCSGDYIGICAGDDYWCDEHKLQKQLDYFKANPDVGVVSTAGYKLLVKSNTFVPNAVAPIHPIEDGDIKKFYFSKDYNGGVYAMPLTLLIKREVLLMVDFDEFVRRGFPVEDFPMQATLSQHCKWGHINDLCVVYRVYKESATFISFEHPKYMQYYKGLADIRKYLNELYPQDACFTDQELDEQMFYKEFLLYLHQNNYDKAKRLIAEVPNSIADTIKMHQAKLFTKSWLHFMAAHYYKGFTYKRDLRRRV